MDNDGPVFNPGDQKVIRQGFPAASSRTANRVYLILMLGLVLLGISCLVLVELVAGILLTLVGAVGAYFFARAELAERAMVKRMKQRSDGNAHESQAA